MVGFLCYIKLNIPLFAVDNDPHFIVKIPGLSECVCYDITGPPGTIFQLLQDKENGMYELIINKVID